MLPFHRPQNNGSSTAGIRASPSPPRLACPAPSFETVPTTRARSVSVSGGELSLPALQQSIQASDKGRKGISLARRHFFCARAIVVAVSRQHRSRPNKSRLAITRSLVLVRSCHWAPTELALYDRRRGARVVVILPFRRPIAIRVPRCENKRFNDTIVVTVACILFRSHKLVAASSLPFSTTV